MAVTFINVANEEEGMMERTQLENSIKSMEHRLGYENARAIKAIANGDYVVAAMAVTCAASVKGAISELEYQLECLEVK